MTGADANLVARVAGRVQEAGGHGLAVNVMVGCALWKGLLGEAMTRGPELQGGGGRTAAKCSATAMPQNRLKGHTCSPIQTVYACQPARVEHKQGGRMTTIERKVFRLFGWVDGVAASKNWKTRCPPEPP